MEKIDGVVLIYIMTTIAVLLVGGWVKLEDWKAAHKHHHR